MYNSLILAPFASRAQALADNLGRRLGEEPHRWLSQAMNNWRQRLKEEQAA